MIALLSGTGSWVAPARMFFLVTARKRIYNMNSPVVFLMAPFTTPYTTPSF
jgi:hypothetical protein